MKLSIYICGALFLLLLAGCASIHFSNAWPYSSMPSRKVGKLAPRQYDDCIRSLESVLTTTVKKHFKEEEISIAVIEISDQIGGFFTTNWGLYKYNAQYHWPFSVASRLPIMPVDISSQFISDGVYHPKAMLRIMFTCYHKYLNGIDFSWQEEIQKVVNLWPHEDAANFPFQVPDTISKLEEKVLSSHYYNLLDEKDTVNIFYNRAPRRTRKSPDWYYLTGVIQRKIPGTQEINLQLTNIESEFKQKFILFDKDIVYMGDTITLSHEGWLKKGKFYFNYLTATEFRNNLP